jgi:hypothetical protein
MATTKNPLPEVRNRAAAPTRRRRPWITLLSAGVLGLVAGCSAPGGQDDDAGGALSATTSPNGATSSLTSGNPSAGAPPPSSAPGPTRRPRAATTAPAGTADPGRITDPQVAADRLVDAWMRHDAAAATRLTRDGSVVEALFGEHPLSTAPEVIPCRSFSPGRFACSYTLAPHAQLTIIVAGGASAGYEVTGLEFGD